MSALTVIGFGHFNYVGVLVVTLAGVKAEMDCLRHESAERLEEHLGDWLLRNCREFVGFAVSVKALGVELVAGGSQARLANTILTFGHDLTVKEIEMVVHEAHPKGITKVSEEVSDVGFDGVELDVFEGSVGLVDRGQARVVSHHGRHVALERMSVYRALSHSWLINNQREHKFTYERIAWLMFRDCCSDGRYKTRRPLLIYVLSTRG